MELAKNKFTHAIAAGEKQIGLWVTLANSFVAEVTAHSAYDWAVIDMEHSPMIILLSLANYKHLVQVGQLPLLDQNGMTQ